MYFEAVGNLLNNLAFSENDVKRKAAKQQLNEIDPDKRIRNYLCGKTERPSSLHPSLFAK